MKLFWLAVLMMAVMPLFAWAGDCAKHGDGCGCAKAHQQCKCTPASTDRCTEKPAPARECPGIDPACCPHSDYRLLCGPCNKNLESCCGHEDFRLLCCAKTKPACGSRCKAKCKSIRREPKGSGGVEL